MFGRATAEDQLGGNFGTRGQRPDADIAARKLFRHHHHRRLRQAKAAEFFGDCQAEHAHFCQFFDDFHRDEFIFQMPCMGKRDDLFLGIATELVADHLQLFTQTRSAKGRAALIVAHQGHQLGPCRMGVAHGDQPRRGSAGCGHDNTQIRRPGHLALRHRNAAADLRQVFAKGDLDDQRLHIAKAALFLQAQTPSLRLAQGFGVGGQPRQRMGGELMFLKCRR